MILRVTNEEELEVGKMYTMLSGNNLIDVFYMRGTMFGSPEKLTGFFTPDTENGILKYIPINLKEDVVLVEQSDSDDEEEDFSLEDAARNAIAKLADDKLLEESVRKYLKDKMNTVQNEFASIILRMADVTDGKPNMGVFKYRWCCPLADYIPLNILNVYMVKRAVQKVEKDMTLTANEKTAYTLYQAFLDDYAERHFGDRRIGKALLLCSRRTYETLSEEVIDEEQLRSNLRLFGKAFVQWHFLRTSE